MNALEYKGYRGEVEISPEDKLLCGKVSHIKDLISFEGKTVSELQKNFEAAIDDYLADCKTEGKNPDKPFKGSFNIRVSSMVHRKIALRAEKRKMSLNAYVSQLLEQG